MSTSKLTDQQVVKRLARREGYTDLYFSAYRGQAYGTPAGEPEGCGRETLPDYLNNHAALQRVMRLLTPDEMLKIDRELHRAWLASPYGLSPSSYCWMALLQTSDLARLVAEVLEK